MCVIITYKLHRHSTTWAIVRSESWSAGRILQKSELNICVCVCVCVCVRARAVKYIHVCLAESNLNPNSNTLQPDRPQHYRLTVFVIAQQYSSATFDFFVF